MVKLRNYARTDDLETAGSVQFRYNKINIPEKPRVLLSSINRV